ncbi:unnamed protein product [Adineta ricciae]|uniref:Calcineurin-like phosphoesterase domain-containing protein n=1 Tax=Adineta ricciae TaxID=249248 RepID=A0A814VQG6_ADIRI|nr:unnamed protein product [Adineta ricciae]
MGNQTSKTTPGPNAKAIFQTMLMSDLHLEFSQQVIPKFPVVASILILAGDIGRPDLPSLQKFLLVQCQRFEHIFYVAGNHCFYEGEYETRLQQLQELNNLHPHIHFLHNQSYLLPFNVRILGTTLWSHVSEEKASAIGVLLNDYHHIWTRGEKLEGDATIQTRRLITVDDTNRWHAQQHAWLLEEISKARKNREHVVIITHHAPSRHHTLPKYNVDLDIDDAFVNDHDADCVDPVRLWMYGHTHASTDLIIKSTRVVSNQLGYAHETTGFRPNLRITLYDDGAYYEKEYVTANFEQLFFSIMLRSSPILLLIFHIIGSVDQEARLIGTHIVYRHGDRTPIFAYSTSSVSASFWHNGFGQLTRRGQLQHIRLGQHLRQRYSRLLNTTYVASELYVRSSDSDRALMSAYSNLVGLYPISKDKLKEKILSNLSNQDEWPELLPWQPIPVHTVPASEDYIMGVSQCPYFFELVEQIQSGEQVRNISNDFQEFFRHLSNWTGSEVNNLFDAWILADAILIEALYNVSGSWADTMTLAKLEQIVGLSFYYLFDSPDTNRLIAGPLIADIWSNIQNLITNQSRGYKTKIYSGHDASIVAVLSFFDANYFHHPPYCATLLFDLYYLPANNSYALKIEYLNSSDSFAGYAIQPPPCSEAMCSIDVLRPWLENRLPKQDMKTECMPRKSSSSMAGIGFNKMYQIDVILISFVFILFPTGSLN